jgi:integrase
MGRSENGKQPTRRARGYAQDAAGQWWAYISQGGKQLRYRCASEAAAKAKRKELEATKGRRINISAGKTTLHNWLDEWLRTIVAPNKKPKTLRFYRQMCEFYISPRLGHLRLEALDASMIRALLLEDMRLGGFAPRTVRHAYTVLRTALDRAKGDRKIGDNPCEWVDPPPVVVEKPQPLTEQEAAALLSACFSHRLYFLYVLAIELGIRKGELLGLEISGLDLDKRTITVRQQVQSIDAAPAVYEFTKNNRTRVLPLTDRQCAIARARLEQIVAEGTQAGGLLFASENGTPMSERNLDRQFKGACVRAGIQLRKTGKKTKRGKPIYTSDLKFHHMRHTCLSWLGDTGANKSVIQAVAGHADADVTDLYVKVQAAAMRAALERLEQEKVIRRAA